MCAGWLHAAPRLAQGPPDTGGLFAGTKSICCASSYRAGFSCFNFVFAGLRSVNCISAMSI